MKTTNWQESHDGQATATNDQLDTAPAMRQDMTGAEQGIWRQLGAGQRGGCEFVRRYPVSPYIVDVRCGVRSLVVELERSQHFAEMDAPRRRVLQMQGLQVLRFGNDDAVRNTDAVIEAIWRHRVARTLTPALFPGRGATLGFPYEHRE